MDDRQKMPEVLPEENGSTVKWTARASVFTDLFSEAEYTWQLYCALHPEDKTTTMDDMVLMTVESHLLNQQYNDLGFMVGDRLIILVEHQSTWSENIVVRVLLYVVETWNKYIKQMKLDVYGKDKINLPKPELYVIYTGPNPENKPEVLSMKDTVFGGTDADVDCKVKIITDGEKGDIINQYVRFCYVLGEQIRIHGRKRKAVEETIRICQDENVLKDYLERQWEEIMDIMLTLFDQETLMRNHDAAVERRAEAKGKAEGRAEGKVEGKAEAIMNLMETMSFDLEKAMDALKIKDEEKPAIRKYVKDKMQGVPATKSVLLLG